MTSSQKEYFWKLRSIKIDEYVIPLPTEFSIVEDVVTRIRTRLAPSSFTVSVREDPEAGEVLVFAIRQES